MFLEEAFFTSFVSVHKLTSCSGKKQLLVTHVYIC